MRYVRQRKCNSGDSVATIYEVRRMKYGHLYVAFIGHREIDDLYKVETKLELLIKELLLSHEYVEFLVGRDGEFDQAVALAVRRTKRSKISYRLEQEHPYYTEQYAVTGGMPKYLEFFDDGRERMQR